MEQVIQDIRYGARRLMKRPVFTLVAVLSLSIGIGANTAIFTMVNAVILRDLPYQNPEELVDVYRSVAGFSHATFSQPDLDDVRRDAGDVFSGVAGTRLALVPTDVADGVELLPAELVTGNYFQVLGLAPALGRSILPEDDVSPGGHPVLMLSYDHWQTRYGGDPGVVGQSIRLNGLEYSIIGVTDPEFEGGLTGIQSAFYAPSMMMNLLQPSDYDQLQARGNQSTFVKARLVPGVSLVEAQARMTRMADEFKAQYPDQWQADNQITLVATDEVIMNPMIDKFIGPAAVMLMTVVGLVLLIACANLASFLLAQAADRRKEVALRLALGARRSRLVRQLMTESVMLAALGGLGGVFLAVQALSILVNADLPLPLPISLDLSLDGSVLAFSVLISLAAGLFFGLAPALQATNPEISTTLKNETAGGGRPRRITLRNSLVVTQVAVCFVLLISAGLFLRSLQARTAVDPGFGYDPAAIVTVQAPTSKYTPEEAEVFFTTLLAEIEAMPGVTAVGRTTDLHLSTMNNSMMGIVVDGIDLPPGQDYHLVDVAAADAGLFAATGIPIVAGRNFDDRDNPDAARVVIVSEGFTERYFPGQEAVGRTFRSGEDEYLVVGVAGDAKVRSLGESARPFVYRPFSQDLGTYATIVASTTGDAQRATLDILALVRRMEPEMLVFESTTMERHLAVMLLPHRLSALIVGAFGVLALLLASIGLYGVVSYSVATRTREVGIRMALGAEPAQVVRMLTGGGLRLVAVGAAIGLVLAFAGGRLMAGLLYGIEATDPVAFATVPAILILVATLSAWLPARRATRVDPVKSLRSD